MMYLSGIATKLCGTYGIKGKVEDYMQNMVIYIIDTMGEFENNFSEDIETFRKKISSRAAAYCRGQIYRELKQNNAVFSIKRLWKAHPEEAYEIDIPDLGENISQLVGNKIDGEYEYLKERNDVEECMQVLSNYVEAGYDRKQAISLAAKELGIDAKTMLQHMQSYLLEKGRVKKRKKRWYIYITVYAVLCS